MATDQAKRFIRVEYDDRREMPWGIKWGENNNWAWSDNREDAELLVEELRQMADAFHDWAGKHDG
jgi:hypothetical protein